MIDDAGERDDMERLAKVAEAARSTPMANPIDPTDPQAVEFQKHVTWEEWAPSPAAEPQHSTESAMDTPQQPGDPGAQPEPRGNGAGARPIAAADGPDNPKLLPGLVMDRSGHGRSGAPRTAA